MQRYLDGFIDYLRLNVNVSPNTLAAYATDVRQFLEFSRLYLDKQELSDLQPEDLGRDVVRAFATDLYANKSARATTARKLSALSVMNPSRRK